MMQLPEVLLFQIRKQIPSSIVRNSLYVEITVCYSLKPMDESVPLPNLSKDVLDQLNPRDNNTYREDESQVR